MHPNINKAVLAYKEIREQFFSGSKLLPLVTIREMIFEKYADLPVVDIAIILNLVDEDHRLAVKAMQDKNQIAAYESRMQYIADAQPLLSIFRKEPSGNDHSLRVYR